jgi:uncharacterized protein (TIGR00369 family)
MSTDEHDEYTPEMLARMSGMIRDFVPHNAALGLEVIRVSRGDVWVRLPYAEKLVGNPSTGALHGGAISSAMDATSGLSIMAKLGKPGSIATLDMRIDYMRAALRGEDVVIHASCYKVTKHVCFVRAIAYTTDEADPVASLAATFARKS